MKTLNRNAFNEKLIHRYLFERLYFGDKKIIKSLLPEKYHKNKINLIAPEESKGGYRADLIIYFKDIQAKRYTNVVGVSNVRDLYGTVINEGANRGILITTSDFGADSHRFVKDKPISLINGQNLLYLLEKHGYSAKIDISEAKAILKAREIKP